MSLAAASSGAPEAKKFRFSLPTQVVVNEFDFEKNQRNGGSALNNNNNINNNNNNDGGSDEVDVDGNEMMQDGETNEYDNQSENGLDLTSTSKLSPSIINSNNNIKHEYHSPSPPTIPAMNSNNNNNNFSGMPGASFDFPLAMLLQQANSLAMKNFSNVSNLSKEDLKATILAQSRGPAPAIPPTPPAPIPGALAVAASPAAQLFSEDDWSWHRNPAAAIRSGGTNKQTPVWKYFVYNKAENLSRCIIGDCTYMLKGPHTSTLACHLKKHPVEYAEFQKLKLKFQQEYTRERNAGQLSTNLSRTSQSSSAENSAIHTPISGTPTPSINHLNGNNGMLNTAAFKLSNQIKPEPTNSSINGGIFGNSNTKGNLGNKAPGKTASMTDILNLLNARASANASPKRQQQKPATPQPVSQNHELPIPPQVQQQQQQQQQQPQPSMMPFSAAALMAAQANNPFIFNLLKQNQNLMNNLNNNNNNTQIPNNNLCASNNNVNPHFNNNCVSPSKVMDHQKKWQRQDRKQRELEIKLSLAIAAAQLPTALIKNPFFRDFIESAQPKFTMPLEVNHIDELINSQYARTIIAVKMQLAAAPKISIIIDVLKLRTFDQENFENVENDDFSGIKQLQKIPSIRLCVSAAYYCAGSQSMEVVLLGIRKPSTDININDATKNVIEELLNEYGLEWDRISRIVTSGLSDLGANSNVLPRMLAPYNRKLTLSLIDIFDTDDMIIELKRDFYTMVYKFMGRPEAMSHLSKQVGHTVMMPIGEPFLVLAENVLKVKPSFLTVCCQQPLDNPIPIISESHWQQLEHAVKLLALFRVHMSVIQDGRYATIDRVVPSLMQLKVSLERDFSALGNLPHRLLEDLHQRAKYILDATAENFDGSFIQATALNPQLAMLLDDSQMTFAKSSIEKLLSERMRQNDESLTRKNGVKSNGGVDALLAAVVERKNSNVSSTTAAAISPPLSSPSSIASDINATTSSNVSTASTLYPDLIQAANQRRKQFQDRLSNGKNLFAEAMVQSYFDDLMHTVASSPSSTDTGISSQATTLPPLQFWQLSSVKCPQLSDIAIELLTVPSCTVSLEKIFNYEGVSQAAHPSLEHQLLKSMENPARMERDAILRFNRAFIPKHF